MKRILSLLVAAMVCVHLSGCGGNVRNVQITQWEKSELYSDHEIYDAISIIKKEFDRNWNGCTLKEITYAGDEKTLAHFDWAERNNADEVIVLISSFDVDSSGGDGSLNPDSTYTRWMWILVRNKFGKWKHVDHGYQNLTMMKSFMKFYVKENDVTVKLTVYKITDLTFKDVVFKRRLKGVQYENK